MEQKSFPGTDCLKKEPEKLEVDWTLTLKKNFKCGAENQGRVN